MHHHSTSQCTTLPALPTTGKTCDISVCGSRPQPRTNKTQYFVFVIKANSAHITTGSPASFLQHSETIRTQILQSIFQIIELLNFDRSESIWVGTGLFTPLSLIINISIYKPSVFDETQDIRLNLLRY